MFKGLHSSLFRYFLLLPVFLGQYCYGQKYNEDFLFNKFRNDVQIAWDDETLESYYLLLSVCSVEALVKYTDDSNPRVRAEIFSGLIGKNADDKILKQILTKHLNDTAKFISGSSNVYITYSVKKYMQEVLTWKADNKLPEVDFKARLQQIRSRRYDMIRGVHHGIISKDSLLRLDSLISLPEGVKLI